MLRRIFVRNLRAGEIVLPAEATHHVRDVLRLGVGDAIELFDVDGAVATAIIYSVAEAMTVRVEHVANATARTALLTIASALPKGNRADWMIEKLAEIGVAEFIPLLTERSVVHPQGNSKTDRWDRLAAEAARQSRGIGVMRIAPPTPLAQALKDCAADQPSSVIFCSTSPGCAAISDFTLPADGKITVMIGPEGGWSDAELRAFADARIAPAMLTSSVLRIETAALVAAGIVLSRVASNVKSSAEQ